MFVTGKVTLALWTCFFICIMGMENTEKHYRVRQKQKAYVADLHGPQSPRRWYSITNTNLFGHNPHMQRAELSTFRCGCQFQPAHVLAVWALISAFSEKVKHLAHTVPHLITSLKPCKIALITAKKRGAAHSLFFPERTITRSLRRAAKLRPSPASIFSIDLHLLHTNTTYRREQDPGRRGGWGERSTWASARGACAVLPGFALGVPAVGTWPPSEKPPTYLLTPGKAQ